MVRQALEKSDLICGSCSAAGQHHGEVARFFVASLVMRQLNEFGYAHVLVCISNTLPTTVLHGMQGTI